MNIWKQIKSTYRKAYSQIQIEKPNQPQQLYKTFASCVTMLCHDDITLPIDRRAYYLLKLVDLAGGPTVREHACMHSAFSIGDAVETKNNGLTAFELDQRFPFPGTWDYNKAYNHSLPYVFGKIDHIHLKVWLQEECHDDSEEDIREIQRLLNTHESYYRN